MHTSLCAPVWGAGTLACACRVSTTCNICAASWHRTIADRRQTICNMGSFSLVRQPGVLTKRKSGKTRARTTNNKQVDVEPGPGGGKIGLVAFG